VRARYAGGSLSKVQPAMKTKWLMEASALSMALAGLAASFLPQELLGYAGLPADAVAQVAVQIAGALYLGFAMLNWMARANLIGGIYSRPVAVGNFSHFTIAAIALVKAAWAAQGQQVIVAAAVVYGIFALLFARVVFFHPAGDNSNA
jgi:hypothetical protein